MVLKGVGPVGYPGMPEVGNLELPEKLIKKGITDMVRISDGRMSGTAYGTVILHVSPESSIGGNLALVQNGDMIELDVKNRTLNLEVAEEELQRRRALWTKPKPRAERGYVKMFIEHVEQADKGCDFDFLIGGSGDVVPRDLH
jgi:dihydroxy-acid dehydratase